MLLVVPNLNAITLQHSLQVLFFFFFFLNLFLFVISNDKISLLPCSVFAFLLRSTESEQNQAGFGRLERYTVSPSNPQYSESQQLIIQ